MTRRQLQELIRTMCGLSKDALIDVICELVQIGVEQEAVRLSTTGIPYHYHTGEGLTDALEELLQEEREDEEEGM